MKRLIYILIALVFSQQGWARTPVPNNLLDNANAAYAKSDFQKASDQYEAVLKMGYESPELYFNLGNAYYKLDKVGMSILNYERARKGMPYDADLNFNLKLANQRTLDKTEALPENFVEEWWNNLTNMQSERIWGLRSMAAFAGFLFFLGLFIVSGKVFTKQLGFWLSILFFVFSTFSFFISRSSCNNMKDHDSAVILSSSVEVKNSPAGPGKKLFLLHEGTKVAVPEIIKNEEGEWVTVQLSPEKVGWVKRASLEFI